MKKILLTIIAAIVTTGMYAIDPITREGKFNVKKCNGAVATYSINWEGTRCGEIADGAFVKGSMPLMEWLAAQDAKKIADGKAEDAIYVQDWPKTQYEAGRYFKEEWNNEFGKKGLRLSDNASEAQYKLEVVINGLDWGSVAGTMFGWGNAGGAIIIGHATLTNLATGERVVRFNINHVQGSGHFTDRFRILLVMRELIDKIDNLY